MGGIVSGTLEEIENTENSLIHAEDFRSILEDLEDLEDLQT